MSLIGTTELLRHATEQHYAVASVNACNYDAIRWVVEAAEQEETPVIVMAPPSFDALAPLKYLSYMAKDMARSASVPVAVHMDHARSYALAVGGIRDGYPSIMVDGSALPYEENVALTSSVVCAARVFHTDVEAELGHVGRAADGPSAFSIYTDPAQALDFAQRTQCDMLAVAVGNAHGVYVEKPHLDVQRIAQLRAMLEIPLVLHGGSGIPDEQVAAAVEAGISKVNLFTEFDQAVYRSMKQGMAQLAQEEPAYYRHLLPKLGEPVVAFLRERLRLLNPKKRRP